MPVVPGAEPYHCDGGPVGVLLLHGLTGSPASLRPWAERFAAEGFTVDLPRLPGHGTSWQELNMCRWPDWVSAAERALLQLCDSCEQVFVCGLSFGAGLALRLAEQHGRGVSGLVLVNPFLASPSWQSSLLPVLKHLRASSPGVVNDIRRPGQDEVGYDRLPHKALASALELLDRVREDLPQVTQPVLLALSTEDHVVGHVAAPALRSRLSSVDVTELVLPDSYHVATLDHDAPRIEQASLDFVRRLVPTSAGG